MKRLESKTGLTREQLLRLTPIPATHMGWWPKEFEE